MKCPSTFEYDYQYKLLDALLARRNPAFTQPAMRRGVAAGLAGQVTIVSCIRGDLIVGAASHADNPNAEDRDILTKLMIVFTHCTDELENLQDGDWRAELVAVIEDEHATKTGTIGTLISGVEDAAQAIWSRLSHERDPLPGLHTYVARLAAHTYVLLEALVAYGIVEPDGGDYAKLRVVHRIDPDYPRRSA